MISDDCLCSNCLRIKMIKYVIIQYDTVDTKSDIQNIRGGVIQKFVDFLNIS